jgi:hypothetical protein
VEYDSDIITPDAMIEALKQAGTYRGVVRDNRK